MYIVFIIFNITTNKTVCTAPFLLFFNNDILNGKFAKHYEQLYDVKNTTNCHEQWQTVGRTQYVENKTPT
ncbi:Uncharacterized protein APZ42_003545 [Daphnia magna]|uniref:Uncharacterized protein n=1 Tax=Daphnia magna TaxID=35525 RepID=A0A164HH75_9CRUS|nr:Uncharacterized protein APZ42_003545 [Daphnia magna]